MCARRRASPRRFLSGSDGARSANSLDPSYRSEAVPAGHRQATACCRYACRGSSASRRPSPSRLNDSTSRKIDTPGPHRHPRRVLDVVLRGVEHAAPARRRRLLAEAEERQARLGDHRGGDRERGLHDQRRHDVGQDVAQRDAQVRVADARARPRRSPRPSPTSTCARVRRMKIGVAEMPIAIIALVRLGPRNAASAIARIRNGQASIASVMREISASTQPPDVAGEQADRHAERQRDRHRHHAREQRGARAPDHARQHVAADLVGAEPVRGATAPCGSRSSSSRAGRTARSTARARASTTKNTHDRQARPSRRAARARAGAARAAPGTASRGAAQDVASRGGAASIGAISRAAAG